VDEVLRLLDDKDEPVYPFAQAMNREQTVSLTEPVHLAVSGRAPVPVVLTALPVRNRASRITGCVIVMRAISESRRVSSRLSWHETHDPLTQLANRRQIENEVMRAIDAAHVDGTTHVLLYIDLYNFSVVNDTCGHAAGDELLRRFAHLLSHEVGDKDVVARIGNDEFAVLLWDRDVENAREDAENILWKIREFSLPWGERRLKVGASIGAHVIDRKATSEIEVLVSAGASCSAAKEAGRNRIHFQYQSQDISHRHNISKWTARVSEALEEDRFTIYCQPIIPLRSPAEHKHYEVLVRMVDPAGNIVPPGKFIPAAEYSGLIDDIDRWVLEKVIGSLEALGRRRRAGLKFSVNLSGYTICDEAFRDYVVARFRRSDIDPRSIQFEITETSAIKHFDRAMRFIHTVKELGCVFLLDDFGSGLSSFGYLKQLPVDYLKIDGVFVRNMELNDVDFSMVSTINHLAHIMGIATVAECVENQTQLSMLEEIGVDYAQGYHLALPAPLASVL
jgi:diguanylate cyclase (GGDEF)-like protein